MRKKTTKGTLAFRIIFGVFSALLIIFIALALYNLWNFLEAYEKSQPEIALNALIKQINRDKDSFFDNIKVNPNEFEDKSAAKIYLNELIKGKITYSRNGKESGEDTTVYDIKTDGKKIAGAIVRLSDKELGYGLYEYEVYDIEFVSVELPTSSYSVTAPNTATVMCNGKEIPVKYITEIGTAYDDTKNFLGYAEGLFPYNVTYTIDGFIGEPEFTAKDKYGNELSQADGRFSLAKTKNEELSNLAVEFSKAYSRYIMDDGKLEESAKYLAPDTNIYRNLADYNNYWCRTHYGYDFLDVNAEDPLFYTENAAVVHLTYDHVLYNVPDTENFEFHSAADFKIYLVKLDGNWKVVEMINGGA